MTKNAIPFSPEKLENLLFFFLCFSSSRSLVVHTVLFHTLISIIQFPTSNIHQRPYFPSDLEL
uniref:Putative ovule protein n=1 Tax=Solanum chacoense TaxID=4108 RepID=A0A0V0IKM8_SOLCH